MVHYMFADYLIAFKLSRLSTILQIASADRNLSTLMKNLKGTALEDTLGGAGPFTILAPVNLAFNNLAPSTFAELLKQVNKNEVFGILAFHILEEKKLLKHFKNGQKLKAINGKELDVTVINGEVRINGAKILTRDRQGTNGVVHSIDA